MDRGALNARLLDALEDLPNVELFFNHKLTGADFRKRKAWIENRDRLSPSGRPREMEIDFDIMLGADGAHSAVRYHMMKFSRMDYQQEYIDTLWCEFRIEPGKARADGSETWKISPNHLHIWPGKDFMFIAIPSEDGSFTCTLFLPANYFAELEADPSQVPSFFDVHFPGVRDHISDASLVEAFNTNPHLPLISLKCKPYHFGSSGVIIGDAAHAMVPFYGQGMNTGMEDVRILFSILDKHAAQLAETNNPLVGDSASDSDLDEEVSAAAAASEQAHAQALAEYSATRWVDAYTINDLAFQNYVEMRTSQSVAYKLRKSFEEFLSYRLPWLGWQTKYSLVVFSNRPYSDHPLEVSQEILADPASEGHATTSFLTSVAVPLKLPTKTTRRKSSRSKPTAEALADPVNIYASRHRIDEDRASVPKLCRSGDHLRGTRQPTSLPPNKIQKSLETFCLQLKPRFGGFSQSPNRHIFYITTNIYTHTHTNIQHVVQDARRHVLAPPKRLQGAPRPHLVPVLQIQHAPRHRPPPRRLSLLRVPRGPHAAVGRGHAHAAHGAHHDGQRREPPAVAGAQVLGRETRAGRVPRPEHAGAARHRPARGAGARGARVPDQARRRRHAGADAGGVLVFGHDRGRAGGEGGAGEKDQQVIHLFTNTAWQHRVNN
ncbi:Kynurenine 3-monooxygenase [Beauveria bassiana D1-5]|uniref:Kynurenine 3-monooxygenase n=1 Tax=Beauveria bassiana D1-5 TaxID=1245745 RepID=A0A0A2VTJ5_BEABA|nr:Kynurenine 3-monooxygenase [Beauveria bassiana D1-5]